MQRTEAPSPGPTPHGRRAARGIMWSGGGQAAAGLLGVVWLFTIPKLLGPANYGILVLLSSLLDLHAMVCTLGVHNSFAYHFPLYSELGDRKELAGLTAGYSAVVIGAGVVGAGIIAWVAPRLGGAAITSFLVVAAIEVAVLQTMALILAALLYGENRLALFSLRSPLTQLLTLPLIYVGYQQFGLNGAVAGLVIATLTIVVWLTVAVRPWRHFVGARLLNVRLKGPLLFGVLSMFGSLGGLTLTRGGNVVMAAVGRTTAEVATFAVGVGFVLQGAALLGALGTALTPGLARLVAGGDVARARDWSERAARYQILAALITIAFVVFVGGQILQVAVGHRYVNVIGTTFLAIIGLLPLTQTSLTNQIATAWGYPRLSLEAWLLLSVTFIGAAASLGHYYGVGGAAAGLTLAAFVAAIYTGWRLRRLGGPVMWGWPVVQTVLLGLPGYALLLLHRGLAWNAALWLLYVVLLLGLLLLTKTLKPSELWELQRSLQSKAAQTGVDGATCV